MTLPSVAGRWAPFVAIGLIVPVVWTVLAVSLDEDRLATTRGALLLVGQPGGTVRHLSPDEPVVNVTVVEVHRFGEAAGVARGDVLEVLVPEHVGGSEDVRAAFDEPVRLALAPARTHAPDTGNTTWTGWVLQDATRGRFWSLQRQVLGGAALGAVPSLGGAALVGYALGLPGRARRPGPVPDAPGAIAGAAWGLVLAAATVASTNALFPTSADGVLRPGVLAYLVVAAAVLGALLAQPVQPRSGGTTAAMAGVGLLLAPAFGLALAWGPVVDARLALTGLAQAGLALGALSALGIAATRYLELRGTRWTLAVLAVAPVVWLWGWTSLDALALAAAPPAVAIALDLARPRWIVRLVASGG